VADGIEGPILVERLAVLASSLPRFLRPAGFSAKNIVDCHHVAAFNPKTPKNKGNGLPFRALARAVALPQGWLALLRLGSFRRELRWFRFPQRPH
jgi:hypothetical protein